MVIIMGLFDSHAHWDDAKFDGIEGGRDALLENVFASGVTNILNAGADISTSRKSISLAEKYPQFYASVGIHPEECGKIIDEKEALDTLRTLASHPKVVAIGEIGLDYYWVEPARDVQQHWLELQLQLARELSLPVIIHDREAHGDCFETILKYPEVRGVFHSYSGSTEMAHELLRRGWYISFSGVITFKNASRVCEVVKTIPLDRILIETDCPYLAPVPFRGSINHSGYIIKTAEKEAELLGIPLDELIAATNANAKRLYGIE